MNKVHENVQSKFSVPPEEKEKSKRVPPSLPLKKKKEREKGERKKEFKA